MSFCLFVELNRRFLLILSNTSVITEYEMDGCTQIKVVIIVLQSLLNCHINYSKKYLRIVWTLFDQNSANFHVLAKTTVLKLKKQNSLK